MPQMPQSIDLEQALLGMLLVYPESVRKAEEMSLQAHDFFVEENKIIWQAISDLHNESKPVEVSSVAARLSDSGQLAAAGGIDYLMQLSDMAISAYNTDYYISVLQEKSSLRKLIEICDEVKKSCFEESYHAEDVLNEAEKKVLEVTRERKVSNFTSSKEAMDQVIQNINYLQQHRGLTGVSTGFSRLNRYTNGLQNGDLIILAARPSVGKTAFAINLAVNAAVNSDKKVALFSLEMPTIQNAMRMLAITASVEIQKIKTGVGLTNEDWAKIGNAKTNLEKAGIYIDDTSGIKMNEIFAKCRKLKDDQGLDMVIVDYLQLISPPTNKNSDSRQVEVSEISRNLKALARELNIPVVALAQLSRSSEQQNRKPAMSDLRESGAIEQDADVILLLSKSLKAKKLGSNEEEGDQPQENQGDDRREERLLEIAKHRNGAVGELYYDFQGNKNIFYEKDNFDED